MLDDYLKAKKLADKAFHQADLHGQFHAGLPAPAARIEVGRLPAAQLHEGGA